MAKGKMLKVLLLGVGEGRQGIYEHFFQHQQYGSVEVLSHRGDGPHAAFFERVIPEFNPDLVIMGWHPHLRNMALAMVKAIRNPVNPDADSPEVWVFGEEWGERNVLPESAVLPRRLHEDAHLADAIFPADRLTDHILDALFEGFVQHLEAAAAPVVQAELQ